MSDNSVNIEVDNTPQERNITGIECNTDDDCQGKDLCNHKGVCTAMAEITAPTIDPMCRGKCLIKNVDGSHYKGIGLNNDPCMRITKQETCNNLTYSRVDENHPTLDSLRSCKWNTEYGICETPTSITNNGIPFSQLCVDESNTSDLNCNAKIDDPTGFYMNHARFDGCKKGSSKHSNPSNANPNVTHHDETKCKYKGCMDVTGANYQAHYNEDGPCEFLGCMDQTALNFDPKANKPDNDKCIGGSTEEGQNNGGFSSNTNTDTNANTTTTEGEKFSNFEGFSITEGNENMPSNTTNTIKFNACIDDNSTFQMKRLGPTKEECIRTSKPGLENGTVIYAANPNTKKTGTNTPLWDMSNIRGYQIFKVPFGSGNTKYKIEAWGANGGDNTEATATVNGKKGIPGGTGGKIKGEFILNEGDELIIVVGVAGENPKYMYCASGGGGATWIIKKPKDFTDLNSVGVNDILMVAGGGGGGPTVHKIKTPNEGNDNENYCPNGAPGRSIDGRPPGSGSGKAGCRKIDGSYPSQCVWCYSIGENGDMLENNIDNLENKPPAANGRRYGNGGGGGFFKNGNGNGFSSPADGKVNNLAGGRAWKSGCAGGVGGYYRSRAQNVCSGGNDENTGATCCEGSGGFGGGGGGGAHSSGGGGGLNGGRGADIFSFNAGGGTSYIHPEAENAGVSEINNPDLPHGCVKITIMNSTAPAPAQNTPINLEDESETFINYTISDNSDYLVVGIILILLLCLFGINFKKK